MKFGFFTVKKNLWEKPFFILIMLFLHLKIKNVEKCWKYAGKCWKILKKWLLKKCWTNVEKMLKKNVQSAEFSRGGSPKKL